MVGDEDVARALWAWLPGPAELFRLSAGLNSYTWAVSFGGSRYLAKATADRSLFESGLDLAAALERNGIRAGGPFKTHVGTLTVPVRDWWLALLRWVPGRPLDVRREDQVSLWGAMLGRVHEVLVDEGGGVGVDRWPWAWVDGVADGIECEEWVGVAARAAGSEAVAVVAAQTFTFGTLHGDPSPREFLLDESTGRVGVVDWGAPKWGPLLYDVAAARIFLGDEQGGFDRFVSSYLGASPMAPDELAALPVFLGLRWAIQAVYFSWRMQHHIMVGKSDPLSNRRALDRARDALVSSGLA